MAKTTAPKRDRTRIHPAIAGLLRELPAKGETWSGPQYMQWTAAMSAVVRCAYPVQEQVNMGPKLSVSDQTYKFKKIGDGYLPAETVDGFSPLRQRAAELRAIADGVDGSRPSIIQEPDGSMRYVENPLPAALND